MDTPFSTLLDAYDYPLPKERIGFVPREPRDSAKLLVYNPSTNETTDTTFAHLAEVLPPNALLVFNNTKVLPARIYAKKKTGGVVEVLCTTLNLPNNTCVAKANKKLAVGDVLSTDHGTLTVVNAQGDYVFSAAPSLATLLEKSGTTPIPPYLKHTPLPEEVLKERYQTIFAKELGSIAAPTASLHFTDALFDALRARGIETVETTLHVNLGTFAPLTEEVLESGRLHEERYEISEAAATAINAVKDAGRPVIAVGTTALRTLESAAQDHRVQAGSATTRLFIREGFSFQIIDGLITNFHVPRSSLMMLVAALVGRERLLELYAQASARDFKFLSFGDGMLILPKK
ncbi:MAG: tRNA preQ1(34) S-adenosylmethionine ribosyltransferase-isomerase QueA [Candidatus Pacebacteria bacterium]|nr:tRNA preQ1(34) S-adenosylmethionine ribosyltransferase-isomerase QueA [Candidatus Paceibacterota bacterium]